MATNTSYLNLALLGIGEAVGTWGVSLNANFQKLDILAGEVISARGAESSIGTRIGISENEIGQARGSFSSLNERLSVLLLSNGTLNIDNTPKAGTTGLGIVKTSVAPLDPLSPVAVGDNDPRMFTVEQKGELVNSNVTSIHKHNLADGAADLTVSADELNQLDGINQDVNSVNLNKLVSGASTNLHNHNEMYYTESETDAIASAVATSASNALLAHNQNDEAHSGSNLNLGNVTVKSIASAEIGKAVSIRANIADVNGAIKFEIKNKSGIVSSSISEDGVLNTKTINAEALNVSGESNFSGNTVIEQSLTVNKSAILGTTAATDTLTINANSTFNGTVNANGGIISTNDITAPNITSTKNKIDAWVIRNDNPHGVTLTQAIDADSGTNITVGELESLTDGSNADSLHTHSKYDTELAAARNSSVFGAFPSVDLRLNKTDTEINAIKTEVINARDTFGSVDARLDAIDLTIANNQTGLNSRLITAEGDIVAANGLIEDNSDRIAIAESNIASSAANISAAQLNIIALDNRMDAAEVAIVANRTELLSEIADAKTELEADILSTSNSLTSQIGSVTTEVNNARGTALTLTARLNEIVGSIDATHTSRIVAIESELSSAKSTFGTVDGRFDALESELTGAKGGFLSINARLEDIVNDTQSNIGTLTSRVQDSEIDILAIQSDIDSIELEIVNARNGETSLDARLDAIDIKVATFGKKFVYTGSSNTSHVVTHNLDNRYPQITIWNTATNAPITDATISATSNNELSVTLGVAAAVSIILIG